MRLYIFCYLLMPCSTLLAQGTGISVGLLHLKSEGRAEFETFNSSKIQELYVGLDRLPRKGLGIGLEYRTNIDKTTVEQHELLLKLGFIIANGSRFQIPIYPYGLYFKYKDELSEIGQYGFGVKAGARLYLTRHLALESFYNHTVLDVSLLNNIKVEEKINKKGFSLGLAYSFRIKKNNEY